MTPLKTRDVWMVGLLSVVTLGAYNIYLMWAWSRELNGILVLNILGLVLDLSAIGIVVGFPLGVAATVLLQRELNEWSHRFGTAASATAS